MSQNPSMYEPQSAAGSAESQEGSPKGQRPEGQKVEDGALRLLHHHPGYLRVQATAFVGPSDEGKAVTAARTAVEHLPGFRRFSHKPRTGSVVIEYEPGAVDADDLLKHIAKSAGLRGLEKVRQRSINREELVNAFLDTVTDINRLIGQATAHRADLRELVPAALAATSVVSFVVGNEKRGRLPRWDSALYRGYRIFMQWHRREVRRREKSAAKRGNGRDFGDGRDSGDRGDPGP